MPITKQKWIQYSLLSSIEEIYLLREVEGWSARRIAETAGVGICTIKRFLQSDDYQRFIEEKDCSIYSRFKVELIKLGYEIGR